MVIHLKKIIISGLIFITLGFVIGDFIFNNRNLFLSSLNDRGDPYFFLQEGIYPNKEIMESNLEKISHKVVEQKNDQFYVYVGITKSKKVADKIKNIYDKKGIKLILKEKYLENEEFSNNVSQFDLLINATNNKEEILTIEEVVLANYEELLK